MTLSLLLLAVLVVPAGAQLTAGGQTVRVQFYAPDVVRVLKWTAGGSPEKQSLVVIARPDSGLALTREETAEALTVASARVRVRIGKADGVVRFETPEGGERPRRGAAGRLHAGHDAVREGLERRPGVPADARRGDLRPRAAPGRVMNYRGRAVKLVQTNTDAVTPVVVSTGGWGLLWDNDSKTLFSDGDQGMSLWSEVADNVDYYFFQGPSLDAVVGGLPAPDGPGAALREVGLRLLAEQGALPHAGRAAEGGRGVPALAASRSTASSRTGTTGARSRSGAAWPSTRSATRGPHEMV